MKKHEFTLFLVWIIVLLLLPSAAMAGQDEFGDNLESIYGEIANEALFTEVDLNTDGKVTILDFTQLAEYWLKSNCQESNNWCGKADIDMSGDVGLSDLITLADNWMLGVYATSYYVDDFNDNVMGSIWVLMLSNGSRYWLDETNHRLEVRAAANSNDDLALYVPNRWHWDTSQDFGFKVSYHNTVESVTWSELLFALGDPEDVEDNHLQFSVCSYTGDGYSGPLFYYEYVQDGSWIEDMYLNRQSTDGWIFISYDTASDHLYIGIEGYGPTHAVKTVSGLLQGNWAGKHIAPHIGGSSDHVEMLSGQAYWDNLILDYGEIIIE